MRLLQNRHFRAALLVSPVLGVLSYVAVDHFVSERPVAAVPGRSYPLIAKSNCRYESGLCVLENGDIEVLIRARRLGPDEVELTASSEVPISQALVSFGREDSYSPPVALVGQGELKASVKLSEPEREQLRWAIAIRGATYFAETPAVFVDREIAFTGGNAAGHPD